MTKTFLRSLLAGFAAAGVAGAQTPPPALTPTSTPPAPAPVQRVAFKQVLPPAPRTAVKANESQNVRVQVRLVTLPVGNAAVNDLFAADRWRVKPQAVLLTADGLTAFVERVAADRQASVLQAPRMNHFDRQSMDFRCGDDVPFDTGRGSVRVFVGTACRMKPTLAADGKSVELAVDLTHTERDGAPESDIRHLKTLAVKDTFQLPVGGSAAVRLGTRTVTRPAVAPPVLSSLPYLVRPCVQPEEVASDVVAVFTVEAVIAIDDEEISPVAKLDKPAPATLSTKVFDLADLVGPPADSPLAKPTDDEAMKAAVQAYRAVRAEQVMKIVRRTVAAASWEENGGSGKMAVTANGQSLVVNGSAEVLTHVGECLTAAREQNRPPVHVQMVVLTAKSDHPSVAKLLDKKRTTPLTAEEVKAALAELKKDGAADILSRPQLMLRNKQTGFFQTGQQFPRLTGTPPAEKGAAAQQQVEYVNTGLVVRMTPDVSADGKFVRLMTEVSMTEPSPSLIDLGNGVKAQPIDSQAVESTFVLPDGGTMAVNVGTRKVEQRIESKVPVLGDLPYLNRLFRNIGVTHVRRDTIVVFTVNRVTSDEPMPVAPTPVAVPWVSPRPVPPARVLVMPSFPPKAVQTVPAIIPPFEVQRHNGSPLPPNTVPVPRSTTVPAPVAPPALPPAVWRFDQVTPIPMPIHNPFLQLLPVGEGIIVSRFATPAVPGPAFHFRTTGPDGLERIGVDFNTVPASGSVPVTGTVQGGSAGETGALMAAYRAACAAGRKDEAARLALQLLAKDPTCFGREN